MGAVARKRGRLSPTRPRKGRRGRPVLTCPQCGFAAAFGEWDLSGAVAVGSVAVVVDLWHGRHDHDQAIDTILSELRAGMGGRWAYLHHRL